MKKVDAQKKQIYQRNYWLKRAWVLGLEIEGREKEAANEAEKLYRREHRRRTV